MEFQLEELKKNQAQLIEQRASAEAKLDHLTSKSEELETIHKQDQDTIILLRSQIESLHKDTKKER